MATQASDHANPIKTAPLGLPLLSFIQKDPLAAALRFQAEFGDVARLNILFRRIYYFSGAEAARQILVDHQDDFTREARLLKIWEKSVAAASYAFGAALIFVAAVSWVVYALIQKKLLGRLASQKIMLVMYLVATLALLPFAHFSNFAHIDSVHWWAIGYCAINTIGAYGAFAEAFVHWEASRVSAVLAVTPIMTVTVIGILAPLMPAHLTPERIGFWGWLGTALVVSGSILAALLKRKPIASLT